MDCSNIGNRTSTFKKYSMLRIKVKWQQLPVLTISIVVHQSLLYTEFVLVWLCRKLLAYRNTLESVPGTNQYWAVSVKFLAHGNNSLSLTVFEPMWLTIIRLLVKCFNHSPLLITSSLVLCPRIHNTALASITL